MKNKTRGGNYGKGPWHISGGLPSVVVVALDVLPVEVEEKVRIKYPNLDNQRIISCKNRIRDKFNKGLSLEQRCNYLHSSDNELEAYEYLSFFMNKENIELIKNETNIFKNNFASSDYNVVKRLDSWGRRSKVELIRYKGEFAVKKTFKPGFERFKQRETFVMKKFSKEKKEIPELIEEKENYIIYPFYNNVLRIKKDSLKLLPLSLVNQMMDVLKFFYEKGYSLIDFHPSNFLFDKNKGLKIIDFEFLYKYKEKPEKLENCYDLKGIPKIFKGDLPFNSEKINYNFRWYKHVGLDLHSLLYKKRFKQRNERLKYFIFFKIKDYLSYRIKSCLLKIIFVIKNILYKKTFFSKITIKIIKYIFD